MANAFAGLNKRQRGLLGLGAVLVIVAAVFPPFGVRCGKTTLLSMSYMFFPMGYRFLLAPPAAPPNFHCDTWMPQICWACVGLECLLIACATAATIAAADGGYIGRTRKLVAGVLWLVLLIGVAMYEATSLLMSMLDMGIS